MKTVHLAKGLDVDAHMLATSVTATLGIRGSGKTNAAAVIAEGVLAARIPVIVLDQVGPWFALRLARDGRAASPFEIPVLGGTHGDIALQPQSGRQVAEALAESNASAVLDVSMMGKGERIRFAADFAEAFFEAKKRHRGPVLLVVEESQRFIPQMMRYSDPALARCLGAFEEMAEVGRNFGIGMVLISQRPQKISKDVLFLSDNLMAFRTLGVGERKTIAEWVKEKGAAGRDEVGNELPGLKEGRAVVWSPALFDVYGTFDVALKATYDASSTPKGAEGAVKMKPLDLGALEASMAAVVAEAKANDPKALKARIAELERAAGKRVAPAAPPATVTRTVEVVPKDVMAAARAAIASNQKAIERLEATVQTLGAILERPVAATGPTPAVRTVTPSVPRPQSTPGTTAGGAALPKGERQVLTAIAQHENGVTREQITVLTGFKRSTRDAYVQRLRTSGLVEQRGEVIVATETGVAALGDDFEPLPTGEALREHWINRLPDGERRVFEVVVASYPSPVSRDAVGDATEFKRSTRDAYLQRLATRKLVVANRGEVVASADLF